MAGKGGDNSAKARANGKRMGRPPTQRLPIPEHDKGMSARILKQIQEEQKIIALLNVAEITDPKFFWEIVKELRHDARGKPVQRISAEVPKPVEVHVRIHRIGDTGH